MIAESPPKNISSSAYSARSFDKSPVFSIYRYGVISRKASVLIIGGICDGSASSLIAKYTIDKWESFGKLQKTRRGHRAIANGDRIYVVGGNAYTL